MALGEKGLENEKLTGGHRVARKQSESQDLKQRIPRDFFFQV